jgi:hypothetical protein
VAHLRGVGSGSAKSSGVGVNVIRAWLGHASLETTNRYAEITIRTKQAPLEKCTPPGTAEKRIPRKPVWQLTPPCWNGSSLCSVMLPKASRSP